MRRIVSAILLGLTAACTGPDSATPTPKDFRGSLSDSSIAITVPAGEWRALRLVVNDLLPEGSGNLKIGIGIVPEPNAQPYTVFGTQITEANTGPGTGSEPQGPPPTVVFLAQEDGKKDGSVIEYVAEDSGAEARRVEVALVLGSNRDATTYYLGVLGTGDPLEGAALADVLAGRPAMEYPIDAGRGGFVGTYSRLQNQDGALRVIKAGNVEVTESVLASGPAGTEVQRQFEISGAGEFGGGGMAGFLLGGIPRAGISQWSYLLNAPPHTLAASGQWANFGALHFPLAIPALGLRPAGVLFQTRSQAGAATLSVNYAISGRQDGDDSFALDGTPLASLPVFVVLWGWVSADFGEMYAWRLQDIVPQ